MDLSPEDYVSSVHYNLTPSYSFAPPTTKEIWLMDELSRVEDITF